MRKIILLLLAATLAWAQSKVQLDALSTTGASASNNTLKYNSGTGKPYWGTSPTATPVGLRDIRDDGAVCDGTDQNTAIQASLSVSSGIFIPAGCLWVTSTLPANKNIVCEDFTAKIRPATVSWLTDIVLEPGAVLTNCRVASMFAATNYKVGQADPDGFTYIEIYQYINNDAGNNHPIETYPYTFNGWVGTSSYTDPSGIGMNYITCIQSGDGGCIYAQMRGGAGLGGYGSGIHADMRFAADHGQGLLVTREANGIAAMFSDEAGSEFDGGVGQWMPLIGINNGVNPHANMINMYNSVANYDGNGIYMNFDGGGFTGYFLQAAINNVPVFQLYADGSMGTGGEFLVQPLNTTKDGDVHVDGAGKTTGSMLLLEQSAANYNGTAIKANVAKTAGVFSGKFFDFQVNSVSKASMDASGNLTTAGDGTYTGNITAAKYNKWTLTAPTTSATLVAGADNKTYTFPSITDTLVGRTTTDTLTNKTLTAPSIGDSAISMTETAGASGWSAKAVVEHDTGAHTYSNAALGITDAAGVALAAVAAGNTGEIQFVGEVTCVADNNVTLGNLMGVGTTTAGRCRDLGVTTASGVASNVQILGRAEQTKTTGQDVEMELFGPGHYGTNYSAVTETLTNKTYNVESTGNVLTITENRYFKPVNCNGGVATPVEADFPTTGSATTSCTGTTTTVGGIAYNDTPANTYTANVRMSLPDDWTGPVDVIVHWFANASSTNAVRWSLASGCVADGEAVSTGPTYNTASATNAAYTGTANQRTTTTFTNISMTNCSASETMFLQLQRVGGDGADTLAVPAIVTGINVKYRRAM